jgi:hypothetical protein
MKANHACIHALSAALLIGTALVASAVPVTVQVNMSVQVATGAFDPAVHTVEIHGSFDNWGAGTVLTQDASDPNLYATTLDVSGSPGTQINYKFVMNRSGSLAWENDGVGPGGAQNRAFTLTDAAQVLPPVYFNNQATPPGVTAVTFQVDLRVQHAIGNFDPAVNTVEVHGSFDNWAGAVSMTADAADANIYQATVNVTGSAGAAFEHKFVINLGGSLVWEGNVGPGGPNGNRTFTLASGTQQLPVVFFNNLTNDLGAGIPVTFRVSLAVAVAKGSFDPATGLVDVRGPFNNWGNPSGLMLTNSPEQPTIFVGTVSIGTASPGNAVPFKFTMNNSWEAGDNRTFTLNSSAQVLPIEYFDHVSDLGPLTITGTLFNVSLSWTPGPGIRLQTTTSLTNSVWEDVPGTLGQATANLVNDPSFTDPGFFRLSGP